MVTGLVTLLIDAVSRESTAAVMTWFIVYGLINAQTLDVIDMVIW